MTWSSTPIWRRHGRSPAFSASSASSVEPFAGGRIDMDRHTGDGAGPAMGGPASSIVSARRRCWICAAQRGRVHHPTATLCREGDKPTWWVPSPEPRRCQGAGPHPAGQNRVPAGGQPHRHVSSHVGAGGEQYQGLASWSRSTISAFSWRPNCHGHDHRGRRHGGGAADQRISSRRMLSP